MKYLKTYKDLGLDNDGKAIFDYFINTLKKSIFTWSYFVDWDKINRNTKIIEKELNLLNYLIGKPNIEEEFTNLVNEYPSIKKAFPILLAIREKKLKDFQVITDVENLTYDDVYDIFYTNLPINSESRLLDFFRNSGLKYLLQNKKIKNLVDYCYGIEVGLDTNARKNRTGTLMENIVEKYLENFTTKFNLQYIKQSTKIKIETKWNYSIIVDRYDRVFDFAIFNQDNNKIYLIEVNYYSGGGSKLKSTAGEYKDLYNFLKTQNIDFIWITDGYGWTYSKNPLFETFSNNDYVFNLEFVDKGVLHEIIL